MYPLGANGPLGGLSALSKVRTAARIESSTAWIAGADIDELGNFVVYSNVGVFVHRAIDLSLVWKLQASRSPVPPVPAGQVEHYGYWSQPAISNGIVFCGSPEGAICAWSLKTGQLVFEVDAHPSNIWWLTSWEELLVTYGANGYLCVWKFS